MNLERLDLNLLVVLRVLHDQGSTTRAATALHLSQPAISHALRRLRDTFDDPLFERRGRTLVATPLARKLLSVAEPALAQLDRGLAELDRFDPASSDQAFVIGLNNAFENILLPPLSARLADRAPRLHLAGQGVPRDTLVDQLGRGELDLALEVALHLDERIRQQHLLRSGYVVIGRRGHPALARPLTLAGYLAERHLLVTRRAQGPGLEDEHLFRAGERRDIALRCQSLWTACQVAQATDYLVTMPRLFLGQALCLHAFSQADFPLPDLSLDVFLYWHESRQHDPAHAWLRGEVSQALAGRGAIRSAGSAR